MPTCVVFYDNMASHYYFADVFYQQDFCDLFESWILVCLNRALRRFGSMHSLNWCQLSAFWMSTHSC